MIRGFLMIATGLSALIYSLKEINIIQIPSSFDLSAITNKLHNILAAIRSLLG
jgi:hypothetical protein